VSARGGPRRPRFSWSVLGVRPSLRCQRERTATSRLRGSPRRRRRSGSSTPGSSPGSWAEAFRLPPLSICDKAGGRRPSVATDERIFLRAGPGSSCGRRPRRRSPRRAGKARGQALRRRTRRTASRPRRPRGGRTPGQRPRGRGPTAFFALRCRPGGASSLAGRPGGSSAGVHPLRRPPRGAEVALGASSDARARRRRGSGVSRPPLPLLGSRGTWPRKIARKSLEDQAPKGRPKAIRASRARGKAPPSSRTSRSTARRRRRPLASFNRAPAPEVDRDHAHPRLWRRSTTGARTYILEAAETEPAPRFPQRPASLGARTTRVVLQPRALASVALDASSGAVKWRQRRPGAPVRYFARPPPIRRTTVRLGPSPAKGAASTPTLQDGLARRRRAPRPASSRLDAKERESSSGDRPRGASGARADQELEARASRLSLRQGTPARPRAGKGVSAAPRAPPADAPRRPWVTASRRRGDGTPPSGSGGLRAPRTNAPPRRRRTRERRPSARGMARRGDAGPSASPSRCSGLVKGPALVVASGNGCLAAARPGGTGGVLWGAELRVPRGDRETRPTRLRPPRRTRSLAVRGALAASWLPPDSDKLLLVRVADGSTADTIDRAARWARHPPRSRERRGSSSPRSPAAEGPHRPGRREAREGPWRRYDGRLRGPKRRSFGRGVSSARDGPRSSRTRGGGSSRSTPPRPHAERASCPWAHGPALRRATSSSPGSRVVLDRASLAAAAWGGLEWLPGDCAVTKRPPADPLRERLRVGPGLRGRGAFRRSSSSPTSPTARRRTKARPRARPSRERDGQTSRQRVRDLRSWQGGPRRPREGLLAARPFAALPLGGGPADPAPTFERDLRDASAASTPVARRFLRARTEDAKVAPSPTRRAHSPSGPTGSAPIEGARTRTARRTPSTLRPPPRPRGKTYEETRERPKRKTRARGKLAGRLPDAPARTLDALAPSCARPRLVVPPAARILEKGPAAFEEAGTATPTRPRRPAAAPGAPSADRSRGTPICSRSALREGRAPSDRPLTAPRPTKRAARPPRGRASSRGARHRDHLEEASGRRRFAGRSRT